MAQVITIAGERLFALKAQNNEQLDIDTFIFANVPGQDPNATIDRNESVPPVGQQVHQQIVQQVGRVNDNVVIYSTVLDSLTGPFDFNWVGLYSSVNQTLIAVSHIPSVSKTITVPGAAGNTLNRNFGIEYSGIADLTGITVQPETWQLDFTARLSGMDELTRQLAADMNGKDWFIGDGFKVIPRSTANTFNVTAGAGYISGLRVELKQDHILTLQSYPQFVYVDAWFDGDASSKWAPKTAFTVTNGEMEDYIDVNGKAHYVFKLARITAANSVEDLRNLNGLAQQINKQKKTMALVMPDVDVTGTIDESTKVLELLNLGYSVKLPIGRVKLNITVPDGAVLLGSGSPRFNDTIASDWDNFGTLIIGTINTSNSKSWVMGNLSIDNFISGGNAINGIGARTGHGYIKNVNTRANNHGQLYETACSNPMAGHSPTSGVIGNIVAEDCEHWGGPNGFVSKHHAVKFIRCKTWGVTVQSFVAVSDNINAATTYNRATDTEFENCESEGNGLTVGGAEGVRIYTQDRFSEDPSNDVNTNGVLPCDNTKITNYRYRILAGYPIRVGDNANQSVASLRSTNTFIDGVRYSLNAFGAILFQHASGAVISRTNFGAGSNIGVGAQAAGIIIDETNLYSGGNVQTGAETGKVIVTNNSNIIENRFWTIGLTYIFRNTVSTLVNQVDYSIYNRPVRFVIDDVFTEINIFSSQVAYKGKGTVIDAMFNGAEWVVLQYGTTKTVNEQLVPYSPAVNFNFRDANSSNLQIGLTGNLTSIDATVAGIAYGSTVGIHFDAGATTRSFAGWSNIWRFNGSSTSGNLGNPPLTLPAYTKLYVEFYVRNGILIEKNRIEYA